MDVLKDLSFLLYYSPLSLWTDRFLYLQNIVMILLLAVLVLISVKLWKRPIWRSAFHSLFQRKLALLSGGILLLYSFVAIIDSFGYHQPLIDPSTGKVQVHSSTLTTSDGKIIPNLRAGIPVYDTNGLTLLDLILKPLKEGRETTYSAPLAKVALKPVNQLNEKGELIRVNPPLMYPGRHLLGTDKTGNDVLYISLKSIRTAFIIGVIATLIVVPFAVFFGIISGYYGGWIDELIQYVTTVLTSIPSILLIIVFMLVFQQGLMQLTIVLGITSWTGLCRVLRAETMKVREMDYVQACRSMGLPTWKILFKHILPNIMHIVLITAILGFSGRVMSESVLSYIGVGVGESTWSWGMMISSAINELAQSPVVWWKLTASFVFMFGLVLPANLFGDALRDALDPRLKIQS